MNIQLCSNGITHMIKQTWHIPNTICIRQKHKMKRWTYDATYLLCYGHFAPDRSPQTKHQSSVLEQNHEIQQHNNHLLVLLLVPLTLAVRVLCSFPSVATYSDTMHSCISVPSPEPKYIFLSTSMAVSCDLFVFGDLCLVTTKIIHALFGSIVCASAHAR